MRIDVRTLDRPHVMLSIFRTLTLCWSHGHHLFLCVANLHYIETVLLLLVFFGFVLLCFEREMGCICCMLQIHFLKKLSANVLLIEFDEVLL